MNPLPCPQESDRYGDVALGVECAWPVAEPRPAILRPPAAPATPPVLPLVPLRIAAGAGALTAFFVHR